PVAFARAGRFRRFVDPQCFDVEAALPPDRLVPVDLMAMAFKLLDPVGAWNKYAAIEAASHDPVRLARALARERWLEENVPMPGAFAREFIQQAYQQDRLLAGTWELRGERIDLGGITVPVLVATARRDFIAPPASCLPLADAVGSRDVTVERLQSGHIGVVVGRYGPTVFYPLLDRWFRSRSESARP
ncbi:MAG: hypothetical protein D6798_10850, partial [Deltaproteobacteria bacterium]